MGLCRAAGEGPAGKVHETLRMGWGADRECSFLPDHSLLVPESLVVGAGVLRTSCEHKGSSHRVFRQRALLGQEIVVVGRGSLSTCLILAFVWDEPGRGRDPSRMGTPRGPALSLGLFLR